MRNILILGGTRDALRVATFAERCCNHQSRLVRLGVIYSIAGLARRPTLNCDINVGGFGGWQGLQRFLKRHEVALLVDATHPYAVQIKAHAQRASTAANIPLYRYIRPEWPQESQDRWYHCNSLDAIIESIDVYQRPFFTIGRSALKLLPSKQLPYKGQHWTIRHIHAADFNAPVSRDDLTFIDAGGPFSLEAEIQLLKKHRNDVIIAKNSGGEAVVSKVFAARQLHLPVILLQRPSIATVRWHFDQLGALEEALQKFVSNFRHQQ